MKTQNFGLDRSIHLFQFPDRPMFHLVPSDTFPLHSYALSDYKLKRMNLKSTKEDPPFDGKWTWTKGRVEGDLVYGEKRADGRYDYELRYDEGEGDRKSMEKNDAFYLRQLRETGTLQQKEEEVFCLFEMAKAQGIDTSDIGEWWIGKLARVRQQGKDIARVLQNAERNYKQFMATAGQQSHLEEQERRQREEMELKQQREREAEEERKRQEEQARKQREEEARKRALEEKKKREQEQRDREARRKEEEERKKREREERERIERQRLEEEARRRARQDELDQKHREAEKERREKEKQRPVISVPIIPQEQIKFRETDKLGEGGFGVVYKGVYQYGEVAIKQLKMTAMSAEAIDEFQKEAAIMSELHHPNIVHFYGISVDPTGRYSMVMEYMPNGSLYGVLHNRQPLEWSVRYRVAGDVTSGLALLHSRNILHRDLKSLNVLLYSQGVRIRAKLTDFGLSKVKSETASVTSTGAGQSVGTLPWMAPELFQRRADKMGYRGRKRRHSKRLSTILCKTYKMVLESKARRKTDNR